MTDLRLDVTKTIHAPIEKVFDAWLDPERLKQFMMPAANMPQPEVSNDARKGGKFSIIMHVGENKVAHTGEYLELDRPSKLVFSWNSPCSAEGSTVSIYFKQLDSENTEVKLSHVKFIDKQTQQDHHNGWQRILGHLDELCHCAVA
ncbi:SRPBCC family protein [Agaribacterium haliotis]|uniref:SRPBCC family protein n=1 Tax=Agaribacterium haliotis TaxID=2013869 RepID=UPI001304334A|nr:SRPBCC family protein [Agaribacterium haliotis]